MGSYNQLCTFHTLIDLLVTDSYYIHAWHRMIEDTRPGKNGVLQNVPLSVGHSLSDVTSASHGSPNRSIRCNQKHQEHFWRFLHRLKTENLQTVCDVYLKCSANILEALQSIVNSLQSCIKHWITVHPLPLKKKRVHQPPIRHIWLIRCKVIEAN